MGNKPSSIESTKMEPTSIQRRTSSRIRRPFSDCTNTIDTLNPSQSSSSSTKNSSSILKPSKLSTLDTVRASVAANPGKTLGDQATGSSASGIGRRDDKVAKPHNLSAVDTVRASVAANTRKTLVDQASGSSATAIGRRVDKVAKPSNLSTVDIVRASVAANPGKTLGDRATGSSATAIGRRVDKVAKPSNLSTDDTVRASVSANPGKTLVDQATVSTATAIGRRDDKVAKSSADLVPLFSTPSRTLKTTVPEGTTRDEDFQPASVYVRRQSADRRKRKEREISLTKSCLPAVKARSKREKMNEDGASKSCPAPERKKRRVAVHSLPQDFIEQQRAYFAEVDAFQLSEEEVDQLSD